jgi:hypothetical protein
VYTKCLKDFYREHLQIFDVSLKLYNAYSKSLRYGRVHTVNQIIYTNSVRTSQETHHVSATKPNRLMLFGKTVAVYCENHTEHTDTLLWAECRVCTSQETHYVSTTKPNRLMLFGETVAVYCENIRNTQIYSVGRMQSFSMLKQMVHIVTTGL